MNKNIGIANELPEWYWKHGLHDAEILSISQFELTPDWKSQNPRYNCFEISINAKGAMFETDIKKISLYNYKLKSKPFDPSALKRAWWLRDTLLKTSDRSYALHIVFQDVKKHHVFIDISFESAEVERLK